MPNIQTLYTDSSKDVIICSYFSNTKVVCQVESFGNNAISTVCSIRKGLTYSSVLSFAAKDAGESKETYVEEFE